MKNILRNIKSFFINIIKEKELQREKDASFEKFCIGYVNYNDDIRGKYERFFKFIQKKKEDGTLFKKTI